MAIPKQVTNFLDKYGINHEILEHKTVYTAYDAAQTLGEKISDITKTLALKVDKKYVLVVLPADRRLDIEKIKKSLNAKKIEIIKEIDIAKVFKIKSGKLLPFGTFHKVPVYVDKVLLKSKAIIISSGSHTESLKLKTKELLDHGAEVLASVSNSHKFKKVVKTVKQKTKSAIKKAVVIKKAGTTKLVTKKSAPAKKSGGVKKKAVVKKTKKVITKK